MAFTQRQVQIIQEKRPDLRFQPIPDLDDLIIEFLKKYDVDVKPTTSKSKSIRDNLIGGAVTGMAGIDAGGDVFITSGQEKQTKVQEWTQWKQWALDHKDFEAFRVEKIDNAKKYNEEIAQKLKDPSIQKQLEPVMEEFRKEKENERKFALIGISIFILFFVGAPLIINFLETRKENSSFNKPIIKTEKITKFIS